MHGHCISTGTLLASRPPSGLSRPFPNPCVTSPHAAWPPAVLPHKSHEPWLCLERDRAKLCQQIGAFMSDIADEFKIVVVDAVRTLCLKFPAKHRVLMNFLSTVLREDGGFEYKKAIVDSILTLICEIPEANDAGLAHLCEFIEVGGCVTTLIPYAEIVGRPHKGHARPAGWLARPEKPLAATCAAEGRAGMLPLTP